MKKYRYRKITPEDVEKMKELREQGLSYKEIGKKFNVSWYTPLYHLCPKERERKLKSEKKYNKKLTKKQIKEKTKKAQSYLNQYIKERYNNDEEFRRRFLNYVLRSRKRITKQRRKEGLCPECGKERKDKKYKLCENCRRKGREYYKIKHNIKNPRK